jgi:type IV secretory pathway VirB10-like protein
MDTKFPEDEDVVQEQPRPVTENVTFMKKHMVTIILSIVIVVLIIIILVLLWRGKGSQPDSVKQHPPNQQIVKHPQPQQHYPHPSYPQHAPPPSQQQVAPTQQPSVEKVQQEEKKPPKNDEIDEFIKNNQEVQVE